MGRTQPFKSVLVMGIESWPLQQLLDRMHEVYVYNLEHEYDSLEQCPGHWRSYVSALDAEWRRRGQPTRLF